MAQAYGDCVVSSDCICSSNYPGGACGPTSSANRTYGTSEHCNVTFMSPVQLTTHLFDVEDYNCGYDYLVVTSANGTSTTKYCGSTGPDGVIASSLEWSTV